MFLTQYYSQYKESYLTRIVLYPLILIFILYFVLMSMRSTRCFLYYYTTYGSKQTDECNDMNHGQLAIFAQSFDLFLFFSEMIIFITFLFNVMKYPIKSDKFKIRTEIFVNFLIWVVYHNLYHGFIIFFTDSKLFISFLINVFQNLSFNLLYLYLINSRNKIDKNCFLDIFHNYDLFMHNHLCFLFFNEYIKNYYADMTSYLAFWVDYYLFKQQLNTNEDDMICEISNHLYFDYFNQERISYNFRNSLNKDESLCNKTYIGLVIDFPVDIQESVEEVAKNNFKISREELEDIFEEAFQFVNNKLYRIYLSLCQNENEFRKIEKIISFVDIDEVKKSGRNWRMKYSM